MSPTRIPKTIFSPLLLFTRDHSQSRDGVLPLLAASLICDSLRSRYRGVFHERRMLQNSTNFSLASKSATKNIEKEIPKIRAAIRRTVKKITENGSEKPSSQER